MYIKDPALGVRHGKAGRVRAQACYSVDAMVAAYDALYDHHRLHNGSRTGPAHA